VNRRQRFTNLAEVVISVASPEAVHERTDLLIAPVCPGRSMTADSEQAKGRLVVTA
jgi:hypothetical protein